MHSNRIVLFIPSPATATLSMSETNNARTVMICDDEQDILLTYAAILKEDYSVITTSSGKQCVDTYVQRKKNGQAINLILLDFKLPDMTGDKVAKDIMLLNGTSIVLISACQLDSKLIDELKRNKLISEFLSKPVSVSSLRETVNRVIADSN